MRKDMNDVYWKANSAGLGLASKAMGAATLDVRIICFPQNILEGKPRRSGSRLESDESD